MQNELTVKGNIYFLAIQHYMQLTLIRFNLIVNWLLTLYIYKYIIAFKGYHFFLVEEYMKNNTSYKIIYKSCLKVSVSACVNVCASIGIDFIIGGNFCICAVLAKIHAHRNKTI